MAIVHVVDRVRAGHGRGVTALAIAQAQHRAGWDVRLLVSGVGSRDLLPAAPAAEPLLGDLGADVYREVAAIGRVAAALRRTTYATETIVAHEGIDLAAACRLGDRAVVAAVHSSPAECLAYLPAAELEQVRRRTGRWIAWGGAVAGQLVALLGIDPGRITVSGQSVSPDRSAARALAGTPAVISVARLHPVKNHTLMVEALAVLAGSRPGVHWHMLGDGEDERYVDGLRRAASRLGLSRRITWHGYRSDAAAVMRGSDVAVLASHSEGLPRAIQEAMVLGVPTVMPAALAPDLSFAGLPIRYAPQEPRVLAEAITAALRIDRGRLTAAAEWVERRWGWPAVLADWERALTTPLR